MPVAIDDSDGYLADDARESERLSRSRSADKETVRSNLGKVITQDKGSEAISPLILAKNKDVESFNLDGNTQEKEGEECKDESGTPRLPDRSHRREFSANVGRQVAGRSPRLAPAAQSPSSVLVRSTGSTPTVAPDDESPVEKEQHDNSSKKVHGHGHQTAAKVLEEIAGWIQEQKAKRSSFKARPLHRITYSRTDSSSEDTEKTANKFASMIAKRRSRRSSSDTSDTSLALEELETILEKGLYGGNATRRPGSRKNSVQLGGKASRKLMRRSQAVSSDTEYQEGDKVIPTCNVVLDNTKTLSNSTDAAWSSFRYEILRLAHTLRIKGWRRIPMTMNDDIDVTRLSGALTNAVYVVTPPVKLPEPETTSDLQRRFRKPAKLLLRVYGPNADTLIDRDSELQILRRLARKNIGPQLLGTFANGRFEQYLDATTLRPQDLRQPETSMQIAKRMRELHEGIELLDHERAGGPYVWRNWECWKDQCQRIVEHIDARRKAAAKRQGFSRVEFVCGLEWNCFQLIVENYRDWLEKQYGGAEALQDGLIFAHNDTQYGNIMRLEPPGQSPLLLPANQHRRLVVIDFEFANANVPGYEFANHFTEWCYNYHAEERSWACNTQFYPSLEERLRFIRTYIHHQPHFSQRRERKPDSDRELDGAGASTPKLKSAAGAITDTLTRSPAALAPQRPTDSPLQRAVVNSSANVPATAPYAPLATAAEPPRTRQSSLASLAALTPVTSNASTATFESYLTTVGTSMTYENDAERVSEDHELAGLMQETKLWRAANSVHWVLWGIIQAQVPSLQEGKEDVICEEDEEAAEAKLGDSSVEGSASGSVPAGDTYGPSEDEEIGEFKCLRYAHDRALFFWATCVSIGIVTLDELDGMGLDRELVKSRMVDE